jgi:hypothetical protein
MRRIPRGRCWRTAFSTEAGAIFNAPSSLDADASRTSCRPIDLELWASYHRRQPRLRCPDAAASAIEIASRSISRLAEAGPPKRPERVRAAVVDAMYIPHVRQAFPVD